MSAILSKKNGTSKRSVGRDLLLSVVLFRRCLIQSILIDSREPVTPKCDGAAMMLMLMVPRGCSGGGAWRLEQPATA